MKNGLNQVPKAPKVPIHLKLIAWINIAIQASFPLAVTFTPAIADTGSDKRFLKKTAPNTPHTQAYTLGIGESVDSVAKKYRMSLDALRKLNQSRIFPQGFEHIQPGDVLDVPVSPLPEIFWDDMGSTSGQLDEGAQAQKVADYASRMGGVLTNNPNSDAAASLALGMASGAASSEIQQWLSRFGNARVQLDADKNFSLKNSQLDLLVPLFEQKDRLFFTQGSIHRTDSRSQSNLGFGYRWFEDDRILGVNTFLDYDLSRGHARLGVGGEYWRDYLKLGANAYQRLTTWKNSPDLEDHEERPANGWDIRAQAWIPRLPQLGGKLTYEQYYGADVALFGRDNRQRNPHAITAGVNYTPVPLFTLSAEQRQGKAGENDARFGIELNYQLGMPWSQQIDPDAVSAMRSLAGSRYDFVDRNNNIVLEYRKKEVIHLQAIDLLAGYAGEQKSLGVSVTSKYGLDHIDWSASSLIAAGGKIVQNGRDWMVVLPAWHSGNEGTNTYTVSGVAVDKKGNASNRTDTQVTVTQAAIDASTSVLSPPTVTLPADGVSQQELVLNIKDKEGRPVDIAANEIKIEKKSKQRGTSSAIVSEFTRRAAGEYVMTITAGTMPELFTLTPSARNTHFASTDVALTADNTTAMVHTMDVVADNAIADGKALNRFRVTVVDAQNNPVPGQLVTLQADNHAIVAESAVTDANGNVVVSVTSQYAGDTAITASVNDKSSKTLNLTFRPDQSTAQITQQDLSILPAVSLADGKTQKTVTARVTDAHGNAIPDVQVAFSADNGAVIADKTGKTDIQGMVTTTLTSTVAGTSHVKIGLNNKSVTKDTVFTGDNATAIVSAVNTTATTGIADGMTVVKFSALIKDQNGNPLSGIPVDWKSNKDSSIVAFSHSQTLTSDDGIAEVEVTSTRVYTDVVVTASTNASSKSASPLTFVADKQNPVIKSLSSDKQALRANAADAAGLMVKVTDSNGNPLSGVKVTFSNDQMAEITPTNQVTDVEGVASASLITRYAGQVTVSAALDNGTVKTLTLQAISDEQTADVTVKADKISAVAGQAEAVTLIATVVDANNNPVSGTSVAWQTSHNQLSDTVSQTNANGQATIQLTGTQAMLTKVTAVLYNGHKGSAQVNFAPGEPANEHSTLSVSPQSITADGNAKALASLILRDKWDNPVSGQTVDWSTDTKSGIHFVPVEKGDGVYQASITGEVEGVWPLNAQSGSVNLQTSLALLASQDSAQIKSVTVSGVDSAAADGKEIVTLRAQVMDKNGNTKLKGVAVGWDTTLGTLSSRLSTTDDNGVAEITLSSHAAGNAWVSGMLGGSSPLKADKPVSFIAGSISADNSSLSIYPANIIAEKESATLTITARDSEGNLLTGMKNEIKSTFTPDLNMSVSAFNEVSTGVYQAEVTGKKAGTTQIAADVNSTRIKQNVALTINADNDTAKVKGSINASPATAKVGEIVTYSAVLTDANDNVLGAGIPVAWSANEGSTISSPVTRTDETGTARVTLTRKQVGTAQMNIILPLGTTSAPDVIFTAGDVDENHSELMLSPSIIVAGKETATLTAILRDSNGNVLTGQKVSGQSDNSKVKVGTSQEDNSALGSYNMAVNSDKSGSATLSVKVGDKVLKQSRILTVKGDTDSWRLASIVSDKQSLIAGDENGVTYSATVTDAQGNLLNDVVVSWQLRGQAESYAPTSRTNEKGVATTTVKSQTAGILEMTAYIDATNHLQANNVSVIASDISKTSFNADKTRIGSDGKEAVTLTTRLEDRYGNPVIGKTVIIEGADTLDGFKLSEVQDLQNGRYVATGTSTTKGPVTLRALVDGKIIGDPITITVGAITPDLRFNNAEQSIVWTKNFTASQAIQGMPEGVEQMWSSSDRSVATVDGYGKVTLLKSGTARISVYTPGNEQYNSAMASYIMEIAKANPGLKAGTGNPIVAVWADGKEQNITATYTNGDVDNSLPATYATKNAAVVTVDKNGKLTAVKPGTTSITVSTPETDQFLAASVDIAYTLNKATADVSFAVQQVKTTDEDKFTLQKPTRELAPEASIKWTSSNHNVIDLSDSGAIQGDMAKGQTRLTLSVIANDYYNASSGYYDVMVYTRPSVSLGEVSYISRGSSGSSGTWTPVFTDDLLSVNWGADTSDEFSKPVSVTVSLVDTDNQVVASQVEQSPTGTNVTRITPNSSLWGKRVRVVLTAKGYGDLETQKTSSNIEVKNLVPNQIWTTFIIRSKVETMTSVGGDTSCRSSYLGREHWNNAIVTGDSISFDGKTLIAPMSVTAQVMATQNENTSSTERFPTSYQSVKTNQAIKFGTVRIAEQCWNDHVGGYRIIVTVNYGGSNHTYTTDSHGWGGNGDGMRVDNVDRI